MIAEAVAGLTWPSESDEPVNYFELPASARQQWPVRNASEFLMLLGKVPGTPVKEMDVAAFFARWRQSYDAPVEKVRALEQVITRSLKDAKGYCVGEVEVELYVLGLAEGRVCGIRTMSVET
ncbi:MAG TPA: nuclease A inhibitor family protein [Blastocatellia bacterium]|nr:nuclease A inhibitor family protein [Blastocatellia bacterium]